MLRAKRRPPPELGVDLTPGVVRVLAGHEASEHALAHGAVAVSHVTPGTSAGFRAWRDARPNVAAASGLWLVGQEI